MVTRADICIWNKHDFQKKSRSKGIGDFLFWALREKWRRRENLQPWHKSVKLHCIVQPNIIFIKNILQGQIISYSIQSRTSATESYCKTTGITLISLQSHPPCTFLGAVREEGLKNFFTVVTFRVFSLVFFSSNLEKVEREGWEWDCGGWVWEELWLLA